MLNVYILEVKDKLLQKKKMKIPYTYIFPCECESLFALPRLTVLFNGSEDELP